MPGSPGSGALGPEPAGWRWPLLILVVLLLGIGALIWSEARPPRVELRGDELEVHGLFYGATVARADVVSVTLAPSLPRVLARTNGFAAAGSLRGHFRVEGLGDGRLFLEQGEPPYLKLLLHDGFLFLGFRDADRTRALYHELARAWPERCQPNSAALTP